MPDTKTDADAAPFAPVAVIALAPLDRADGTPVPQGAVFVVRDAGELATLGERVRAASPLERAVSGVSPEGV